MSTEDFTESEEGLDIEGSEFVNDTTSRARNRTVMLTPEITGEVRARLAKDFEAPPAAAATPAAGTFSPGIAAPEPAMSQAAPPQGNAGFQPVAPAPPAPMQAPAPQSTAVPGSGIYWAKQSRVRGFLVSYDENENGEVYDLRSGRLIVTSEAAGSGSYLVVNDASVSPMHAILKVTDSGAVQVLDQLSENGTLITKFATGDVYELSGDKGELEHGDTITFGDRRFVLCMVPEVADE